MYVVILCIIQSILAISFVKFNDIPSYYLLINNLARILTLFDIEPYFFSKVAVSPLYIDPILILISILKGNFKNITTFFRLLGLFWIYLLTSS